MGDYFFVLVFTGLAAVLVGVALIAARLIAPRGWTQAKGQPYECGEKTIGRTWIQFNVGYYLFALLFLVFDVEAAFLYPWALVFREVGVAGLVGSFDAILVDVVREGLAVSLSEGLRMEAAAFAKCKGTIDMGIGMTNFMQNGPRVPATFMHE